MFVFPDTIATTSIINATKNSTWIISSKVPNSTLIELYNGVFTALMCKLIFMCVIPCGISKNPHETKVKL